MGPKQILTCRIRVDLGVIATKRYSTLPKAPEIKPYKSIQISAIALVS